MRELVETSIALLRSRWRPILLLHLAYTGLGIIVFAPLLGMLGSVLLKLSGKPALADMDLLFFALSPAGAVAFVLFAAVLIVISAFEMTSIMAIGVAAAMGRSLAVFDALLFALRRAVLILKFAGRLVIRVLIVIAPYLVVGGGIAFLLITQYDINYYLSVKPPEFWLAAGAIGIVLLAMAWALIRHLVRWSLALPLVLFVDTPPAESFAASEQLTRENRRIILGALMIWAAAALLLAAVVALCVKILAGLLVPAAMGSITLLAILFGLLLALWSLASALGTAFTTGSLALLLVAMANRFEPRFSEVRFAGMRDHTAQDGAFIRRRWFAAGLVAAVIGAVVIGYRLLDQIRVIDQVQIIAHRGAAGAAPENTLAAFRQAMVDGTDWIELDVQETADGQIVVVHDSDFMKLAGVKLRVWEGTMAQIAEIDVGSWYGPRFATERPPALAEVIELVKGRSRLIVELKYYGHDEALEQRVIDLLEDAGMQNDAMLMSLEYPGIQKVRALRPGWKIGLLSARAVGSLADLDADFLAVNMALATPALVRSAHAVGKQLFVWTVNDALGMSQMMSLGVDGIITDEPGLARQVLAARAELSVAERLLLHMAPLVGIEAPSLGENSNDADAIAIAENAGLLPE